MARRGASARGARCPELAEDGVELVDHRLLDGEELGRRGRVAAARTGFVEIPPDIAGPNVITADAMALPAGVRAKTSA